jgi:shikimate dehydrogenase
MRKFGLIGYPLVHSFSKMYFTNKFMTGSITGCTYDNYEIEKLDSIIDIIRKDHELVGLNVTIPYKSEIIKYLDKIDEEALEIGAVNVLKISDKKNKRFIKGFNSDVYGFKESLLPYIVSKTIKSALVLGTGGSSKAVAFVLQNLGIKVTYLSRISTENTVSYSDLNDDILADNKLIVNTTPLGMYPNVSARPGLNYDCLSTEHILYDLVYNPAITSFLKKGQERGCTIVGGMRMLELQAERSWEIWNDKYC